MTPIKLLFFRKNSGEIARQRLKLLLVSDRAGCSAELLEMIRSDFFHCISRYLEVEEGDLNLGVIRRNSEALSGNIPALYASIPIPALRK